jgi:hypothetical protein
LFIVRLLDPSAGRTAAAGIAGAEAYAVGARDSGDTEGGISDS